MLRASESGFAHVGRHEPSVWKAFLLQTAEKRFGATIPTPVEPVAEKTPVELLQDVYVVVEQMLQDTSLRRQSERVLTAFANHNETQAWLYPYGAQI